MDKTRIHEALFHQKQYWDGGCTDEDVLILMDYWKQVADLTQGIESLKATNVFAVGEYYALQLIADARGL